MGCASSSPGPGEGGAALQNLCVPVFFFLSFFFTLEVGKLKLNRAGV